ncbi:MULTISPECIES: Stk1 family PASTA domain-containing Ser/Thr kinase [unclassified Serinicoccus]|uniref:Stk1 family PASTA domain-containing Ser/Thr kinase n=1 Tax=unclassified Serinicoccus TaxID=2643101 RepID=UPI0038542D7F
MSAQTPSVYDRVIDGRYQVEAELAHGGMATVYRARDLRLDRPVALKVMRADLAGDDAFVRRFVQEARAAARLQHPHVVSVYDQGEDEDVVFLAMELVEGSTLRDVIRHRSPMSTRAALALLVPVVEALAEAHRRGLVHRDIKPENVLIAGGREAGVKVADFGLARAISASGAQASAEMLWGTAAYLAPEQVEHDAVDARTDVYAVGLLLFELLSGRKAFPGGDPLRVAYEHVHGGVPRLRATVPTVPVAVDELVHRAAATEPADRPEDAGTLLRELRVLTEGLSPQELDAIPEPVHDEDRTQALRHSDHTQLVGGDEGSTRRIPVAGATGDGHFARTTGNRERATTRSTRSAPPGRAAGSARPSPTTPPPRRRGRRRGLLVVLVLLGVLGLGGVGYGAWWYTDGPGVHSAVPVLVDLPEDEARELLDARQLDPVVSYDYSEGVTEGVVISTDQPPGTELRHGSDVALVVSQGQERYAVPPLTGLTLESAQDALSAVNLTLGEQVREHDEDEPEGRILSTSPEVGELLPPDGAVDVVISDGPAPVQVPDVTGDTQEEATAQIQEAGLTVTVDPERTFDDEVPEGSVVGQSPTSGSLERGSTVTLTISQGPELVTVPQVVGRQFSAAEEELSELGLEVEREDVRGGFFGTVREQSVEDGEEVPVGTVVVLTVV